MMENGSRNPTISSGLFWSRSIVLDSLTSVVSRRISSSRTYPSNATRSSPSNTALLFLPSRTTLYSEKTNLLAPQIASYKSGKYARTFSVRTAGPSHERDCTPSPFSSPASTVNCFVTSASILYPMSRCARRGKYALLFSKNCSG